MLKLINIFNWIKSLDKNTLAFIAGGVLVMFMMQQCNRIDNLKEDLRKTEMLAETNLNNYIAANDSIRNFKNKNGDLVSQISSYQFDISDLQKINKDLTSNYIDALSLNEELEGVKSLLMSEIQIRDSIIAATTTTQVNDSTAVIKFQRNDDFGNGNSRNISGSLTVMRTLKGWNSTNVSLLANQNLTLRAAIENIEGIDQVKISTSYPGLTIGSIENINLINNKLNNRSKENTGGWSGGIGIGYGVSLTNEKTIGIGPTINFGLYWSPNG